MLNCFKHFFYSKSENQSEIIKTIIVYLFWLKSDQRKSAKHKQEADFKDYN